METILLEKVKAQLEALRTNIENLPDRIISFSTEETIVGTWIDGSPLYALTMIKDNLEHVVIDSYWVYDLGIAENVNPDVVLWAYGAIYDEVDDRWYALPYNRVYRSNQYIEPEVFTNADKIVISATIAGRSPLWDLKKSVVTVYYTKKQVNENEED